MPRKKVSNSPRIVKKLRKSEPKAPASKVVKKKAVSKTQNIRKPRAPPRKSNKKSVSQPLPQELPQILLEKVNIGNFSSPAKSSKPRTSKNSSLKLDSKETLKPSNKRKAQTDVHNIAYKLQLSTKKQKQDFKEAVSESIVEVTQFQVIQPKVEPRDNDESDDYSSERNIEYNNLIKSESLEDYCTDFSQEQCGDLLVGEGTSNAGVNKIENCMNNLTESNYFSNDYLNITIKQSPDMDIVEHLPNFDFPASDDSNSQYTTLNCNDLKHDTSGDSPKVSQAQSSNAGSQMKKLLDNIKNLLIEFKKEKALYRTASNKEMQKLLIKTAVEKLQLEISELRAIANNPENSNKNLGKPLEILNGFERFLAKNNFNENYSDDECSKSPCIREELGNISSPEKTNTMRRDSTTKSGSANSSPNQFISQVESQSNNRRSTDKANDACTSSSDVSFNAEKSLMKSDKSLIPAKLNSRFTIENVVKPKEKFAVVNVENIFLNKVIVDKYNLGAQLTNAANMVSHTSNNESRSLYNTSASNNAASSLKFSTMEGDHNKKPNNFTITVPRITITQDLSKAGNRVVNMVQTSTSTAVPSNFNFSSSDENFENESYMSEFDDECSFSACYWTECYNFSDFERERIKSLDPIFDGATLMHEETIENIRQEINAFQYRDGQMECQSEKAAVQSNSNNLKNIQILPSVRKTEENQFKVPISLAAKRPPTRIKNAQATSTVVPSPVNLKVILQVDNTSVDNSRLSLPSQDAYDNTKSPALHGLIHEDDAISLYADSIQSETLNGQDIQFPCKPTNVSSTITTSNVKGGANVNSDVVVKLPIAISTADNSAKLSPKIVDPEKHLNVIQWINNTATAQTSRTSLNKSSSMPPIFAKLCTYYFFKTCLKNFQCKRYHHIPPNIRSSIENLPYDDLTSAYNYIRNSSKLYIETIDFFINGFVNLKCDKQLIVMALDVLDLPIYNKTPVVKKYISALEKFNLTFIEAIGKIVDDSETIIGLSDIILDIICAQAVPDIIENWVVVQKLAKNRGRNLIDHGIVKDIMIKSYIERNAQLAKYIVDDIISPHIVELKAIQSDKIIKFCRLISCQLPDEKYSLMDRLREYKVTIDFTKLNCSSLFKNSCKFHTPRVKFSKSVFEKPLCNPNSDLGLPSLSQDIQVEKVIPTDDIKNEDVTVTDELIKTIDLTHEESEKINIKSEPNQAAGLDDSFNSNFDSKSDQIGAEHDLKKLSDIISQGNSLGFLAKLYDFQGTSHSRWFILNSICFFKLKPPPEIYKMFNTVLNGLEQFSSDLKESDVGKMFRTLTLNMVIVLAQEKAYHEAAHMLLKYYDELDTLIKVEWFLKSDECDYSEAGKYLHFCKIFTRGGLLQEAVTLLRNSDLKLIYKSETWPMKNHGNNDIEFRNRILKEMMLKAIDSNILIAKDLILFILMEKDHISEINIWKYFNQLIITMLESGETYKEDLKSMIGNILEGWYNNLSTLALRGLLVILLKDIPENVASNLYHKCSQKSIYQLIKGTETHLTLKTDMADEEIYMTLQVYFEKAAKRKYQLQDCNDLILQIALPNTHNEKLHLVINNNSVSEFKTRAYKILASCFSRAIHIENTGCEPVICIKSYQLQSLFTKIN